MAAILGALAPRLSRGNYREARIICGASTSPKIGQASSLQRKLLEALHDNHKRNQVDRRDDPVRQAQAWQGIHGADLNLGSTGISDGCGTGLRDFQGVYAGVAILKAGRGPE